MNLNGPLDVERALETDNKTDAAPRRADRRRWTGRLPVLGLVLLLVTTLAFGAWSHYEQHRQVIAAAEQSHDLVPEVRVASVQPGDSVQIVSLPATTSAFAAANVFARASGYIAKRVVAPFDGVITQRNVDIGSLVQADATSGTFMFTIMQGNVIRTQVFVPQDQAFGLQAGIDALVRVPEIPNRTFPGKVTRIANALQPGSRTLLTEIDIPNPDGTLSPGIYCTIELHIPRKTPSFKVSADAIIFNEAGLQVAVLENGVVYLRKVTIVRDLGQEVEVNSGVERGDQVILNPAVDLADGSKVRAGPRARQIF